MFLAHISEDKKREQTILEHLEGTAALAASFADVFDCGEWGYGCGLLHDIGKYSDKFQQRLRGGAITDHATAGAKELYKKSNYIGAYCISGHHSGLLDGGTAADGGGEATLRGRMQKTLEDYSAYQTEITIPEFHSAPLKPLDKGGFSLSFFIRMLFSCVVDADYLDTERFMTQGQVCRQEQNCMGVLFDKLFEFVEPWLANNSKDTVNGRRSAVLRSCLEAGKRPRGVFQLTVPTGGGKTVSSLAFALKHAKEQGLRRIIYVIPYTSIIEQNAKVFKEILGEENVLEDHCNVVFDDSAEGEKVKLAAENWDCPVVVTTNVQFFESLFANKTSKCRKLHNIADSVIIFDEAQMLPVSYLKPCIRAVSELVYNYKCSAVLCTATQPALKQFFPQQITVSEICPDVEEQYEFFRRTVLKNAGELQAEQLAEELMQHSQALCILNSRKGVQRVYDALQGEGTFHLSTLMYPKHRKRALDEIRKRLSEGQECRVIATSLVEAGVDLDFQTVYRELAGVDSVIQAAGRCNREGKRPRDSSVTVIFTLPKFEDLSVPQTLKLPVKIAGQIQEAYSDISSLDAVDAYFRQLYRLRGEALDRNRIVEQLEDGLRSLLFPFAEIAEQFKLIEKDTKTLLIDREPEAKEIARRIERGECSRSLLREAGQFCVNVYDEDFENLNGAGMLKALPMDFYVLRSPEQYTQEKGLELRAQRGDALFV